MTTRLATQIAALLLAAFAPSALAAPQAAERVALPAATAGPAVAATRLGGLEATRAISLRRSSVADASPVVGAVAIDGVDEAEIAAALLARPAGSRVLVTANLIAGLVGNPRDRVVVNGRITDHPSPWFDAGIAETAPRFKRLADELNRLGAVPEALIVVGDHDLLAESVAGGGDRRWMALRNDHRFATVRSENFHLEGVIAPGGEQWNRWNEFVQSQVSAALELVVQDTLGALFPSIELAWYQPATAGASAPASAPAARLGAATVLRFSAPFGGATTDPLAAWSAVAAEMQRSATAAAEAPLLPVVLPRSHAGSRTERSAISGTPLWDELVRHLALRGGGTILLDDRAIRDRQVEARDDLALAAILAEVAAVAAEFAGGGSHLAGNDHLGTMVRSPSGDRLLRITLAPGIASAWIDLDGERLLVSADPGGQGVWLRVAADGSVESKRSIETASLGERAGSGRSPAGSPHGDEGAAVTIVGDWSTSGLGDLNGDGVVDGADLAIFLATQGVNLTDLNGDGVVDGADLAILLARPGFDGVDLANWLAGAGPDGWTGAPYGDLDGDGAVGGADLAIHLANAFPPGGWGGQPYGDLDGDGAIGGADLAIWLAGVGAGAPAPDRPIIVDLPPTPPAVDPSIPITPANGGIAGGASGSIPPSQSGNATGTPVRQIRPVRERIIEWWTIGGTSPDASRRGVGAEWIGTGGWPTFVVQHVQPSYAWGVRRFWVHNPFGTRANEHMRFDQYLEAQAAGLNWLTDNFAQSWAPIVNGSLGEPVELIAYIGTLNVTDEVQHVQPPHRFQPLYEQGRLPELQQVIQASIAPLLAAGASIGADAAVRLPDDGFEYQFYRNLDASGTRIYVESRPRVSRPRWSEFPVVALETWWHRSNPDRFADSQWGMPNHQILSERVRIFVGSPTAGAPISEVQQWVAKIRQALLEGDTVVLRGPRLRARGVTFESLVEGIDEHIALHGPAPELSP